MSIIEISHTVSIPIVSSQPIDSIGRCFEVNAAVDDKGFFFLIGFYK